MNHNNEWNEIFPEVPQSFRDAVRHALNAQTGAEVRTPDKTRREKTMKRRFPVALVAVIAILAVTAAAAAVIEWNAKLADRFGADEQQQNQLVTEGAVATVDQTVTENGLTVTVLQTLGDKNGVYLLFDVKAPEGIALTDTNGFESTDVSIEGTSRRVSWSGGFLSNTDESGSASGKANERYYELWLSNVGQEDWKGKKITVSFANLQADKGKLDLYTITEGEWTLSWTLSYSDQMQTFDINKTYNINGHEVMVKSIELSPLSMTLNLGGDGLKQLIDDSDLNQCGCLYKYSLTMQDGTTLSLMGPGSENWTDTSHTRTICFDKVLDADRVTGLTLTFPWEDADNTLTVDLP